MWQSATNPPNQKGSRGNLPLVEKSSFGGVATCHCLPKRKRRSWQLATGSPNPKGTRGNLPRLRTMIFEHMAKNYAQ